MTANRTTGNDPSGIVDLGQGRGADALRRHNHSTILRYLHLAGAMSRSELTRRTELNRSTVSTLVAELADLKLVVEGPPRAPARRGRPSPEVSFSGDGPVVLAVDVNVDAVSLAIVGLGGVVQSRLRVERPNQTPTAEEMALEIRRLAVPMFDHVALDRLVGIGISVVGIVQADSGLVRMAPNLGWTDEPLADLVAKKFPGDVPVTVGNDADLACTAEQTRGACVGIDDFVTILGRRGIGAGVVSGGRPLGGADGYAGELGHVTVRPGGRPCSCGSRGCLETEVGLAAMLEDAGLDRERGELGINEVIAAASASDADAARSLRSVGHWLGAGVAIAAMLFNPGRIVLAGYLGRIYPYVESEIAAAFAQNAPAVTRASVAILPSRLGDDGPLLGAAETALEATLRNPGAHLAPSSAKKAIA